MNLADMLSYADIQELKKIAATYSCECNSHSKNELIQSILSTVNRREVFEEQVSQLSMEDIRFLNSLLYDRRNSFSMEELVARVQQTKFSGEEQKDIQPREMILKFKQHGWLFHGFSQQTKYLFQVPDDLKKRFNTVLAKKFGSSLVRTGKPSVYRDEQTLFQQDILAVLLFFSMNEIPLTGDLFLYKRQLQQLLDLLSVQEKGVPKGAWRFGYGRRCKEYPDRFSLIYDVCYFDRLIAEEGGRVIVTGKGKELLESGNKPDITEIYKIWLRLYKNPVPNIQSLVHWIDTLADEWVTVSSLQLVLVQLIRPFYYDSAESIFHQRLVRMMMHLGFVQLGEDDRHGQVIKMTPLGHAVIQDNYVAEEDYIHLRTDPDKI